MSVYMIGNAHIDPVWLWQWREGRQEVLATFRSALDRLEEHPGFVFTCACAAYYAWVERTDPGMFAEIRRRVEEGRWVLAGGMWIQPDMNAPSGESLARQLLYSQRWFAEKLGRAAAFGYNVDSFGHNASVPMLLRAAGLRDYVWMRPGVHENPAVPEGPMAWESPDGSRVLAFRIAGGYTGERGLGEKIDRLLAFGDALDRPVMCFYGVGNHGGGPTRENLRQIDAYLSEAPRGGEVRYGSPADCFRDLRAEAGALPVWRGELQHHASGCYSTHSASKRRHRRAENALLRMETLSAVARALTGHRADGPAVSQAWRGLMFNEFHDILGGCCLPEAMEDVLAQLDEVIAVADREEAAALQAVSWRVDTSRGLPPVRSKEEDWSLWGIRGMGTPVVVFNPHPFEAKSPVRIRRPVRAVRDGSGAPVPCQLVRASRTNGADKWDGLFEASAPPWGYATYWVFPEEADPPAAGPLRVGEHFLENGRLRAEFDPRTGGLVRLIHRESGRDALRGASEARLVDIESCDTWAHGVFRFDRPAGRFADPAFRVVESGPVRAALEVTLRHGASTLTLRYHLYCDGDSLEVEARLDLHERFRMVKLCWPTGGERAFAEIPFGLLERPMNGDEEPCQRWIAAGDGEGGLAVLNDGKYSYSAAGGELMLTVANTSLFADHYGQAERDRECAFMDQGLQTFRLSLVPFAGALPAAALNRRAALLNRPMPWTVETYHKGPLPERYRGVTLTGDAAVTALKRAEDGGGWIVRLAGVGAAAGEVELDAPLLGRRWAVTLPSFGIRTCYLPDDPEAPVRTVLLTEADAAGDADAP